MDKAEMRSLCEAYITKGATAVPEHLSKQIIQSYGVNVPAGALVKSAEEAGQFAAKSGYPLVLKAVSSEMLHKTELEGV
ncbi:acetate--CoA ligase family protein, partial [Thermodesulfobacteriota bacterium]